MKFVIFMRDSLNKTIFIKGLLIQKKKKNSL